MYKIVKKETAAKKPSYYYNLLGLVLALVFTALFILSLSHHPFEVFGAMVEGVFGSSYRMKSVLRYAVPLIVIGIGISAAFKMKFWNIGAEGQMMMGGIFSAYLALNFGHWPALLLLPLMMLAALLGGGLYGLFPAMLKKRFGLNEVIVTLMLNYIALELLTYLQFGPWKDPNSLGFPKIANFSANALLPRWSGVHIGIFIALLLVVVAYLYHKHSKIGYEVSVIGDSEETANYAGINTRKVMYKVMFVSGGLAGLAGMIQASGDIKTISVHLTMGAGFTAIIVAWLAALKPQWILVVALLFAMLTQAGYYIQTAMQIPASATQVIQSIILFCMLGSDFFKEYKIVKEQKQ